MFDPNRYSPVRPGIVLALPESNARAFWVASIFGRFLRRDGSSERLKSAKEAGGSLVTRRRRAVILQVLGISESRWRALVVDWERRHVAHRCHPGQVFLFAEPLPEECPACHVELLVDHAAPPARRNRGRGFEGTACTTSGQPPLVQAVGATSASGGPPLAQALSGTLRPHPPDRSLRRDEVGLGGSGPGEAPRSQALHSRRACEIEGDGV